jgi:DNA-binding GntR family transcriptional regulator
VAAPSVAEARQVFTVRRMLEAEMVRALVRDITPSKIKALKEQSVVEKTALKDKDLANRTEVLGNFHIRIAELLDNDVLVQMMVELLSRCSLITLMYQTDNATDHACDDHEALIKALAAKDEALAVSLMDQHLHHIEASLTFDRKIPSNDIAMALA